MKYLQILIIEDKTHFTTIGEKVPILFSPYIETYLQKQDYENLLDKLLKDIKCIKDQFKETSYPTSDNIKSAKYDLDKIKNLSDICNCIKDFQFLTRIVQHHVTVTLQINEMLNSEYIKNKQ